MVLYALQTGTLAGKFHARNPGDENEGDMKIHVQMKKNIVLALTHLCILPVALTVLYSAESFADHGIDIHKCRT